MLLLIRISQSKQNLFLSSGIFVMSMMIQQLTDTQAGKYMQLHWSVGGLDFRHFSSQEVKKSMNYTSIKLTLVSSPTQGKHKLIYHWLTSVSVKLTMPYITANAMLGSVRSENHRAPWVHSSGKKSISGSAIDDILFKAILQDLLISGAAPSMYNSKLAGEVYLSNYTSCIIFKQIYAHRLNR